jgi:hypothetical protein
LVDAGRQAATCTQKEKGLAGWVNELHEKNSVAFNSWCKERAKIIVLGLLLLLMRLDLFKN